MKHNVWLLFIVVLCLPVELFSQDSYEKANRLSFFEQRARQDAKQEQSLQLKYEEDQIDYWTDQRNFENELKKLSYKVYQVYLKGKRDAYSEHEEQCGGHCDHGDYYYLQADFYFQYGKRDYTQNPVPTIENTTARAKLPVNSRGRY